MKVQYSTEEIQKIYQDFYYATGVRMSLLDTDYKALISTCTAENKYCAAVGKSRLGRIGCRNSDIELLKKARVSRKPVKHICHAGLVDIVVPIIHEGEIIGYIILGQLKTHNSFEAVREMVSDLNINLKTLETGYNSLEYVDYNKVESVINITTILAKYILLANIMRPRKNKNLELITEFINNNLTKKISVLDICHELGISKSSLYKLINVNFGCTVSEYINEKRIQMAITLLYNEDLSIEEISQAVGFSNTAYFSKVFKNVTGASPLKYKKTKIEFSLS